MTDRLEFLVELGVDRADTDPFWSGVRLEVDETGLEHWIPAERRHDSVLSHRWAWSDLTLELNLDPLQGNRPLYRRCGSRWCVHPAHLGRRRGRRRFTRACPVTGCTNPEHGSTVASMSQPIGSRVPELVSTS